MGTIRNYTAGGVIGARLFAKPGASDTAALVCAAANDAIFGVTTDIAAASGERVDVIHDGLADLTLGGTVTRGQQLTSNASGAGIAVTAAGQRVGAIALESGVSGDIIPVLVTVGGAPRTAGRVSGATFTIGEETGGNTINVAIQLTDEAGVALAARAAVKAYLATDANGDTPASSAPSGGIAIGTDGAMIEWAANLSGVLISEADGDIDINIVEAGAATWYLILVMPDGSLVASGAITFAG